MLVGGGGGGGGGDQASARGRLMEQQAAQIHVLCSVGHTYDCSGTLEAHVKYYHRSKRITRYIYMWSSARIMVCILKYGKKEQSLEAHEVSEAALFREVIGLESKTRGRSGGNTIQDSEDLLSTPGP